MGIRNDVLCKGIGVVGRRIDATVAKDVISDPFHCMSQVSLFFVKECLSIGDEKLKVAELRPVDGGIVELCDDTFPQCEP